jgi:hypothetical protein
MTKKRDSSNPAAKKFSGKLAVGGAVLRLYLQGPRSESGHRQRNDRRTVPIRHSLRETTMNHARHSIGTIVYLVVLAILSAGFAWDAVAQLREYDTLRVRGRQVAAVVVRGQTSNSPRNPGYFSILRYPGPGGKPIAAMPHIIGNPDMPQTGQEVMVVYDPDNPARVRLAREIAAGPGYGPWISGGAAALFFAGIVLQTLSSMELGLGGRAAGRQPDPANGASAHLAG